MSPWRFAGIVGSFVAVVLGVMLHWHIVLSQTIIERSAHAKTHHYTAMTAADCRKLHGNESEAYVHSLYGVSSPGDGADGGSWGYVESTWPGDWDSYMLTNKWADCDVYYGSGHRITFVYERTA